MKSKYLIISTYGGIELPIIFNPILTHNEVAGNLNVISAGFCAKNCVNTGYIAWGGSVSLGKKSRLEDTNILNNNLEYNI